VSRHASRVRRRAGGAGRPELGVVLVRPDGYVAWATERGHDSLDDAIATWFG